MTDEPIIAAIAAMARNRVIGKDNALPWHIPEELKYFRRTTLGKPVIMGRKSYESFGSKPLPGRANIVVTGTPERIAGDVIAVRAIDDAIARAKDIALRDGVGEIFIIGGAQIYAAALPMTQRLYLTVIDRDYEGHAMFPKLNPSEWNEVSSTSADGPPPYAMKVYERI